jgi:hypothetical protein
MFDITPVLKGWDFNPDEVTVRMIDGCDQQKKIQMRLDLGLLQMNCDGRPDGKRPHGYESLYEYYQHMLEDHLETYENADGFFLDPDDCDELRREAEQYYYRYLSLFHMHEYEKVERDTSRNLRVFNFLKMYAEEDDDKYELEQYRPYVLMMHARAKAQRMIATEQAKPAIEAIEQAIQSIQDHFTEMGRAKLIDSCSEVIFLERFLDEIQDEYPANPVEALKKKMQNAVDQEDYESAAKLRDEIHKLQNHSE